MLLFNFMHYCCYWTNIISPHNDITVFEAHHINLLAVDMETRHVGEPLCKFSYVISGQYLACIFNSKDYTEQLKN